MNAANNIIRNGNFAAGRIGCLPADWELKARHPHNAPTFKLVRNAGRKLLLAAGNGSDDCFGHLAAAARLRAGRTYRLRARFRISAGLNPQRHLRFGVFTESFNNGIFHFRRLPGGSAEGEGRFLFPCKQDEAGEVRLAFCFSAAGRAWIEEIALEETAPLPTRPVRIACVSGGGDHAAWQRVLDAAADEGADLALLPEMVNGETVESMAGPTPRLLSHKARQHRMYVAGGFYCRDSKARRVYNVAALYDRAGRLAGRYVKQHPYTPELWGAAGVSPGREVPVFRTDFGTVGIMICYDSWFTDVAELLALKGAEIILFPNAGYFRSLMPARAADNCVRIAASSLNGPEGIWDTAGRDVTQPELDPTTFANCPPRMTAGKIRRRRIGKLRLLVATLHLEQSPSPHNWGGPMLSAPGGRRNRREQICLLHDDIRDEIERWWDGK